MASKYPSRAEIESLFKHMEDGNVEEVFKRVHPDVEWTVMGTQTTKCSG